MQAGLGAYSIENALFQWEEGQRRLREVEEPRRARLERVAAAVVGELRRRLGSSFMLEELTDLYASGADWASDLAHAHGAGTEASWVVDAAFARYAREASDYSGGRERTRSVEEERR